MQEKTVYFNVPYEVWYEICHAAREAGISPACYVKTLTESHLKNYAPRRIYKPS